MWVLLGFSSFLVIFEKSSKRCVLKASKTRCNFILRGFWGSWVSFDAMGSILSISQCILVLENDPHGIFSKRRSKMVENHFFQKIGQKWSKMGFFGHFSSFWDFLHEGHFLTLECIGRMSFLIMTCQLFK